MSLSELEIKKITEIVAGKVGTDLDAKSLRKVIDSVVDKIEANRNNPEITGATCETSASADASASEDKAEAKPYVSPTVQKYMTNTEDEQVQGAGGLYHEIDKADSTRVIVAAFGKNRPGVVAAITKILADLNCSIEDISQTIMQDFFSMIMVVNMKDCTMDFATLREQIQATESTLGMKVYVMHEDIFKYMHRI